MTYVAMRFRVEDQSWQDDNEFYQNTVFNCKDALIMGMGDGWKIYNNILGANERWHAHLEGVADGRYSISEWDHNQYADLISLNIEINWGSDGSWYSMADWRNSGLCPDVGQGSLASDPTFVNSSGNMNQLDDFALAGSSPCRGAGRNGQDIGANISLVGVNAN